MTPRLSIDIAYAMAAPGSAPRPTRAARAATHGGAGGGRATRATHGEAIETGDFERGISMGFLWDFYGISMG